MLDQVADLPFSAQSADGRSVIESGSPTADKLTVWALDQGIELEDLEVARPSLEDVCRQLKGGEA